MGYTRCWRNVSKLTPEFLAGATAIIKASPCPLVFEYDEPWSAPEISEENIIFNGVEDDGHETFVLSPGKGFSFCKTAYKPYDVVVTAILALADHYNICSVSSDGNKDDWQAGVDLVFQATGIKVRCPMNEQVDEED